MKKILMSAALALVAIAFVYGYRSRVPAIQAEKQPASTSHANKQEIVVVTRTETSIASSAKPAKE